MEKFVNLTDSGLEKAIKIGTNVPDDATGLVFYGSERISPANSVSMLDVSDAIVENTVRNFSGSDAQILYADEFGILRTLDGNNSFPVDDLTISNLFLDRPIVTEKVDVSKVNPRSFVHYFYVSRYFIAAPNAFSLFSMKDWVPEENIKELKINVVDSNGVDYRDKSTGEKKYRILLEPFLTETNYNRVETPCRVIVLLDSDIPRGLRLIYDKVECDSYGNFHSQVLRYSENINAVKYFQELPEETFVIDPNYVDNPSYSIKKINEKYSNTISGEVSSSGYQIVTPNKGIKDYRTYEAFNWRLIARTRQNVNFDIINYGQELDSTGNIVLKSLKVGVLYSESNNDTSNSIINPYIFYRLKNSPFNLSKYNFVNPLGGENFVSNSADYWKVNIDAVDDLSQFDILAWSPTSKITSNQVQKINAFLRKSGTLILDLSSGSVDTSLLNPQLVVSKTKKIAATVNEIDDSKLLDPTKNGGWNIVDAIFEKDSYSIIGSNIASRTGVTKSYITFDNDNGTYATSNSFVNVGQSLDDVASVGLILEYPNSGDALSKGNIIATTFPLMSYCNSIYSLGADEEVVDLNVGNMAVSDPLGNTYAAVLEGPFKLFYNIVAYALYCKSKSSRFIDLRSSLYNFVSPWKSSWVMDGAALFDEEKTSFSVVNISSSTQVYARDLIEGSSSLYDFYKSELDLFLPENQKSLISSLSESDIEFFIEITNFDVDIANATKVQQNEYVDVDIPSAYSLFEMNNGLSKLYAYTMKPSRVLEVPSNLGPYVVIDHNVSISESSSLENKLSVLNNFKSYPFSFESKYTYATATDKPVSFAVDIEGIFVANFTAKLTTITENVIVIDPPPEPGEYVTSTTNVSKNAINIKSAIDDLNQLRTTNSSDPTNTFLYSGDIDIHRDPRIWKPYSSPVHEYVKYIQYTMATVGGQVCKVDGIYGSQTAGAVKNFQTANKQRYLDGTVDSETKSFMAFAWKRLKKNNPLLFASYKSNVPDLAITKYITAVENAPIVSSISGLTSYKKLSFSGFAGPSTATDIIWFEVPDGITNIDNVVITPDSSSVWRNYTVIMGYSSFYTTDIRQTVTINSNLAANIYNPTFNLGGINRTSARYMWIKPTGKALSGYGYAEGFSIKSIKINGRYTTTTWKPGEDPPPYTETETIIDVTDIQISAKIVANFKNLPVDIYNPYTRNVDTNILSTSEYISELSYNYGGKTYKRTFSPYELKIGDLYNKDGLNVNFGFSPSNLLLSSTEVKKVVSQGIEVVSNAVGVTNTYNSFTISTSSIYFSNSIIAAVSKPVENYRLRNVIGNIFPAGINTVTVNDGVMLLCDDKGAPTGLLTESDIRNSIISPTLVSDEEIDLRYGYMIINNTVGENDGFIYGFYDLVEREFLGKSVPVLDIYDRGFSNVYIGVCAIDADGNTQNKNEFLGPTVDMAFKPVNVPMKIVAPIFSVKYSNSSIIRVSPLSPNLGKFQVWELPVTNGSFVKKIDISVEKNWTDWKSNYKGQQLTAVYSTLDSSSKPPSEIFGSGYYTVYDEVPEILGEKLIRVSRTPILSWNYKTDYLFSVAGIVKPEIDVYIRDSVNDPWVKLGFSDIRNVDCETGLIEFSSRIIPTDISRVKVTYSVVVKDNLINQVDGVPVPLNPLLNKDSIIYNRPLYVYVVPKIVYKKDVDPNVITIWPPVVPPSQYVVVDEYEEESFIRFTYDYSIFDVNSEVYNPFALPLAVIYVTNNPYNVPPAISDIRLRGGGFENDVDIKKIVDEYPDAISHWDVYPPSGKAYPKGGYVIIRIPSSVKSHFVDPQEIYNIISSNLTAGIVYELQDLDGNVWSTNVE